MKYKIYNDDGILVAVNIKQILELLELNDYKVITNDEENTESEDQIYIETLNGPEIRDNGKNYK